jgi:hypothetical protein
MDDSLLHLIDSAFKDVESICRLEISKYFDSLDYQEKREYDIVPFQPVLPSSDEEVEEHIIAHIDIYAIETEENTDDLKDELIEYCERIKLTVDSSLPLKDFKVAMRTALHQLSKQELLEAGIFGHPVSEQEALNNKEKLLSGFLISIQQAAFEQLLIELGKFDPAASTWNHHAISGRFPKLVGLVKDHFARRHHLN